MTMLPALLGCAPFAQPALVEPGWLYVQGSPDAPSQLCTLQGGTLSCTEEGTPAETWDAMQWRIGDTDLLVSPNQEGGLELCTPDLAACTFLFIEESWFYTRGEVGDLDRDGRDELVLSGIFNYVNGRYKDEAYICWGTDAIEKISCEPLEIETDRDAAVTLTDIDADGDRDVVFGVLDIDDWDDAPTLCRNDGGGGLDCARWPLPDALNRGTTTLFAPAADLNGDGHQDVIPVLYSTHNPPLQWCEGAAGVDPLDRCHETPLHTVAIPEWFGEEWYPHSPAQLTPTDLDNDGDVDLVALSRLGLMYTCANDGRGDFACTEQQTDLIGNFHFGDLDGDGEREILARSAENVLWCGTEGTDLTCSSMPTTSGANLAMLPARIVH